MDTTNTDRAHWGAAALNTFARNAKESPPITAEGAASLARPAAEQHAQPAARNPLSEQAETDIIEARCMIADVVTDVLHHMDGAEPAHMLIGAAYQVYQPVRRLLTNRAYELAAQHHVLVPQNEQFGVLRESVAHQHPGEGQKPPGHLVQQRHDHPDMVPAEDALLLLPAATTIRAR